jgi:hypothetical protein
MKTSFFRINFKLNILLGLIVLSIPMLTKPAVASAKDACVRASNGNVVCGQLVPKPTGIPNRPDPSSIPVAGEKVEQDGLSFQSLGCKTNNKDKGIVCDIVINNLQDSNRIIRVWDKGLDTPSRAIEPSGDTSFADLSYIVYNQGAGDVTLNPSLPTKISLMFSGTSKNAVKLTGLAITYSVEGIKHDVVLRNVIIRR